MSGLESGQSHRWRKLLFSESAHAHHLPALRNLIELVRFTREEILCPSCGSSFRLEGSSTTSHAPRTGQKIGKFEIMETIGVGAFGTVYKARDPELDRIVAVKVPRSGNLADDHDRDRFLREARSVAQLRHPSIVPVHEVGQQDGLLYLASEFVEGMTLADLLSGRRAFLYRRDASCDSADGRSSVRP